MRVDVFLTSGQRKTQDVEGTFVYVERSPGWVQIETIPNGYVYDLPPRGQIILPVGERFDRLNITNASHVEGDVELSVGFGQYIPSNSGQVVTVDNVLTPIEISKMPPVRVLAPDLQRVSQVANMGMETPAHIEIEPRQKVLIARTNNARKELIVHQFSQTLTTVMLGDRSVSGVAGLPVTGSKMQGGGTVLTGGFEVWAYNDSESDVKLALMEVML